MKITSAGLAGFAASAWPSVAFGSLQHLPTSLLSAGYAEAEPEQDAITWLTPAQRLLAGDSAFISRDAQVTIRSSFRPAGNPDGATIDVVFPALGYQPDEYPIYRAWSVRREQSMESASGAVSFRVPIEATSGLQLVFTRIKADADPAVAQEPDAMLQLALGVGNAPKLQRGIYVVAYGTPGVSNWSAVPITRKGRSIVVPNAKFAYVMLSIDYAG